MPLQEDSDALTSQMWRVVFLIPGVFSFIQFILLLFIFKYETPKFYQIQGDVDNYIRVMQKLYDSEEDLNETDSCTMTISHKSDAEAPVISQERCEEVFSALEHFYSSESQNDVYVALVDEADQKASNSSGIARHYVKALILGCILSAFHQLTGINAVMFYSNELFTEGKIGNEAEWTARLGTLLLGFTSFFGSLLTIPSLKYFNRLTLINLNQVVMALCFFSLSISTIFGLQNVVILLALIFAFSFHYGIGPILWIYTAEILDERG